MPPKLTLVDPLSCSDHYHLSNDDRCYHLGEYTARRGFSFSETNDLIDNFKKSPSSPEKVLVHKRRAINTVARAFRAVLASDANIRILRESTLIPVPPSAKVGDSRYDGRMLQMLESMGRGLNLDIRDMVRQECSTEPAHRCSVRPSPSDLYANYFLDQSLTDPAPEKVMIFDDMLTTGAHFKAIQRLLRERFPSIMTMGMFIARRVPEE